MTKTTTRPMTADEITLALGAIAEGVAKRTYKPLTILGFLLVVGKLFSLPSIASVSWWLVLLPFYILPASFVGAILGTIVAFLLLLSVCYLADVFVLFRSRRRARNAAILKAAKADLAARLVA